MDENINVYVLTRNQNNRFLYVSKVLAMRNIEKMDFKVKAFEKSIFNDRYIINGNKLFYLYDTIKGPHS